MGTIDNIFFSLYICLFRYFIIGMKNEIIIIVGGKEQIECEGYLISQTKWIDLPPLPEDRYKCSLLQDE